MIPFFFFFFFSNGLCVCGGGVIGRDAGYSLDKSPVYHRSLKRSMEVKGSGTVGLYVRLSRPEACLTLCSHLTLCSYTYIDYAALCLPHTTASNEGMSPFHLGTCSHFDKRANLNVSKPHRLMYNH